jgi:hypothetical protein
LDKVPLLIRGKLHRRIPLKVHPLLWRLRGYTQRAASRAWWDAELPQTVMRRSAGESRVLQISIVSRVGLHAAY